MIVEVCVDSPAGVEAALRGGADRIELCSALALGGLTPSHAAIAEARRAIDAHATDVTDANGDAPAPAAAAKRAELVVLIRPRPGDFVFEEREARVMEEDIAASGRLGADAVAVGALLPPPLATAAGGGFSVDTALLARLTRAARAAGLGPCCFHRAFDLVEDAAGALEQLAAGDWVGRVLSSGAAERAADERGSAALAALVRQVRGRGVDVVAAGGIRPGNVASVVRTTGVRQVHSAALSGEPVERPWRRRQEQGQQRGEEREGGGAVLGSAGREAAQDEWRCADEATVRAIVLEARGAAMAAAAAATAGE